MANWEPGTPDWAPSPWLTERDEVLRGNEPGSKAGYGRNPRADHSRSVSYAALSAFMWPLRERPRAGKSPSRLDRSSCNAPVQGARGEAE